MSGPESHSADTVELFADYVAPTYGRFPLAFDRGEGAYIWSESGERYLDFGTGIAVCSLGHCPPFLSGVIREQSERLLHCSNLYLNREQGLLARHLVEKVMRVPGKVFFCNSGAEANEVLIKLARKAGKQGEGEERTEIITFEGSFHGRTMAGIAATGQDKVKAGFEPLLPGFVHLPFGDLAALDDALGPQTAAVLLEPVQGEGGIRECAGEFLEKASRWCRERGALFLLDEVQCGLGRLGEMGAWRALLQDVEVEPDGVSWAKGLGGGIPIGATWITDRADLSQVLGPGTHGSTFGGNPLAAAAARAVLEEIESGRWDRWAAEAGARMVEEIRSWNAPPVREVRGRGLMLGVRLDSALADRLREQGSSATPALHLVKTLMKEGLLTVPAGPDVVRLLPPLNVSEEEIVEALGILKRGLSQLPQDLSQP